MTMHVPLCDLYAHHLSMKSEINEAIDRVITRTAFIGGEEVSSFEKEFAAYCGSSDKPTSKTGNSIALHCASCGNGTDALYLALRVLGVRAGDEVITVAHTFIATAEAISLTGARPVFVDIRPDTWLMDPDAVEAAITPRTRAIIAVHLYGQPCDMDRLAHIARRHDLKLIEDAAQAHGARWKGQRVGSFGDAACFSFYPGKNLGAYGDGGAVVSRNGDFIRRVRMVANHGRLDKYVHEMEGVNSRLDGLHAAILRVKLRHLDESNAARRAHAELYRDMLRHTKVVLPFVDSSAEHVWHLFVIRVSERDALIAKLKEQGIAAGVHYPVPLHRQPAYAHLGISDGSLPVTEQVAASIISLPMYPELTKDQIEAVVRSIEA